MGGATCGDLSTSTGLNLKAPACPSTTTHTRRLEQNLAVIYFSGNAVKIPFAQIRHGVVTRDPSHDLT